MCSHLPATEIVRILDDVFSAFDQIAETNGLERLKTIGDAFVVVGNATNDTQDHANRVVKLGLDMVAMMNERTDLKIQVRIGIHTDKVVAGVIATTKLNFDAWGEGMKIAERVEANAPHNGLLISQLTFENLTEDSLKSRFVKGKTFRYDEKKVQTQVITEFENYDKNIEKKKG
eukprot:TRINITY_DN18351_c0_g1_i1.p1 TRINITY_DN18351_c0_g1~~TRINITY_DN18351_c0_g1_i1.p1  ORF type:complete len:174 (-),score=52.82 TRINITY_DN18351_c0_g1_i1:8-529(-)